MAKNFFMVNPNEGDAIGIVNAVFVVRKRRQAFSISSRPILVIQSGNDNGCC